MVLELSLGSSIIGHLLKLRIRKKTLLDILANRTTIKTMRHLTSLVSLLRVLRQLTLILTSNVVSCVTALHHLCLLDRCDLAVWIGSINGSPWI